MAGTADELRSFSAATMGFVVATPILRREARTPIASVKAEEGVEKKDFHKPVKVQQVGRDQSLVELL